MSRRARAVITGILATGAVLVAGVGLVYASVINGGLDNVFDGDQPHESDPEVVTARTKARDALTADGALLAYRLAAVLGGSSSHLATGEVPSDCQVGRHNWKIDDPFDLSCTLARVEVVAASDQTSFREQMEEFDVTLRAGGWQPGAFDINRVMRDYWADRAAWGAGYAVDDLPSVTYERDTGSGRRVLGVQWAQAGSATYSITDERNATFRGTDGRTLSLAQLVSAIPPQGYAVVLTESFEYFVG